MNALRFCRIFFKKSEPHRRICSKGRLDIAGECAQATSDRQGQNPKSTAKERSTRCGKKVNSPLFEIARVLMCLNHVASVIVNANHGIV